ncbi:copper transporter [Corynebacterium sphenisci]|uniref:copper transporter n=1 Tax=Corynebacterium sphenisci TaxID=191493 RepID=UPI0009515256|nr:copper transporter [Corynebacterium sphenisci]
MGKRAGGGRGAAAVTGAALGVAAGAALGAYVLAPDGGITIGGATAEERAEARLAAEHAEGRAAVADEVLTTVQDDIIGGRLRDAPTVLLVAPDADPADVAAVAEALRTAGAPDGGRLELTAAALSADRADALGDVIAGALPAGASLDEARTTPGRHTGQALASALLLDDRGGERATAEDRELLLGSLREAGFVDYEDGTLRPSAAIVVVAGRGTADGEPGAAGEFGAGVLAETAAALRAEGGAVVLAGRPAAADEGGAAAALAEVPDGDRVDAVAAIGDAAGRILVINDLRNQLDAAPAARPAPAGEPAGQPDGEPAEEPAN